MRDTIQPFLQTSPHKRSRSFCLLILSFFSMPILASFSANAMDFDSDDWGLDGRVRGAYRDIQRSGEDTSVLRVSGRLRAWVALDEESCVKLRTRVATGRGFGSEFENTSIGNQNPSLEINLRHLYVDVACAERASQLEVGAVPVRSEGNLGFSASGWLDGFNLILKNDRQKFLISAGALKELQTPSVFDREDRSFNFYQAEISHSLKEGSLLFMNLSKYEGTETQRLGLIWALTKYAHWIKSLRAETHLTDWNRTGHSLFLDFKAGEWTLSVGHSRLENSFVSDRELRALYSSFQGEGNNSYVTLERTFKKRLALFIRLREGDAPRYFEVGLVKEF